MAVMSYQQQTVGTADVSCRHNSQDEPADEWSFGNMSPAMMRELSRAFLAAAEYAEADADLSRNYGTSATLTVSLEWVPA